MKKIGLLVKDISENRIKSSLKEANSFFVVKYSGLSSPDLTLLRESLNRCKANFFVVKNSVARRALKDSGFDAIIKIIEEPCGFVFIKEEPVDVSKILCSFSKDHGQLRLEGGFLQDKVLEKKDIEILSKLPAKVVLLTQMVRALNSPLSSSVNVLSQTLKKFVYCLDQIKQKKEKG
ncbi:MAG: 50S ribosomal protein L10 [Candidatus Omnitrophota bacterium]